MSINFDVISAHYRNEPVENRDGIARLILAVQNHERLPEVGSISHMVGISDDFYHKTIKGDFPAFHAALESLRADPTVSSSREKHVPA